MFSEVQVIRWPRQVLTLGLLVALFVLALSACGGGGGEEQADKPRPLPEESQELLPGTYSSEEFKPSLSFRIGEGWSTAAVEVSDRLVIAREGETIWLFFTNPRKPISPVAPQAP